MKHISSSIQVIVLVIMFLVVLLSVWAVWNPAHAARKMFVEENYDIGADKAIRYMAWHHDGGRFDRQYRYNFLLQQISSAEQESDINSSSIFYKSAFSTSCPTKKDGKQWVYLKSKINIMIGFWEAANQHENKGEKQLANELQKKAIDVCLEIFADMLSNYKPPEFTATIIRGDWKISRKQSPIDDSTNVYLSLLSPGRQYDQYGRETDYKLYITCRENTTSFFIDFGGYFMSDHRHGKVIIRLDKDKARTIHMQESNNNEALGLWRGNSSIPFIKSMFGKEKMYVQATPYSKSSISATYNITGLKETIKPLRKACNW